MKYEVEIADGRLQQSFIDSRQLSLSKLLAVRLSGHYLPQIEHKGMYNWVDYGILAVTMRVECEDRNLVLDEKLVKSFKDDFEVWGFTNLYTLALPYQDMQLVLVRLVMDDYMQGNNSPKHSVEFDYAD